MPIFGNKEIFAIEIKPFLNAKKCYISFCCCHVRIGDPTVPIIIEDIISWTSYFLENKKNRYLPNSHKMTKERLFYELYESVYDNENFEALYFSKKYKVISNLSIAEKRKIFHLDYIGMEAFFDSACIVLIDEYEKKRQRLIWGVYNDMSLHEGFLPSGYFDQVAAEMLKYLNTQQR